MTTKNEPTNNSMSNAYFNEHLAGVYEKPTQEHDENLKNSSLLIGRLKRRPAFTYKSPHTIKIST
jgi:hypothetical protein